MLCDIGGGVGPERGSELSRHSAAALKQLSPCNEKALNLAALRVARNGRSVMVTGNGRVTVTALYNAAQHHPDSATSVPRGRRDALRPRCARDLEK